MAETKTARSNSKSTARRSSSNGSPRSRGPSGGSRSRSSRANGKSVAGSRSSGPRSSARKSSRASTGKKSGPSSRSRSTGGASAKQAAPSPVSKAMERAKGPAIAGGAALVGLAGGLALKNGKKRNGFGSMPRPKVNLHLPKPQGSTVKIVGGAAKEIAKGGYKIGQLTSEVQKVRKAVEGQQSDK